ncbi:PREDICTED: icarapin-like [Polistes canadensis]|uniref:icarapin-like n=1 Tax=Polistes canadensis TaxID=91411 RepID=UPI000718FC20|nr:PREDICTED: icarapin-like [Polistes canadensis]
MKLFVNIFIVATCFLAFSYAFPAFDTSEESDEKKNVDTVLVLPGSDMDVYSRPRIPNLPDFNESDGSWPLFRPSSFDYLSDTLHQIMNRLREQMASIASRFPLNPGFSTPWSKIPLGGNTTSTTKIINGHVLTINETIYKDNNDTDGIIFRVRVIDVKPQDDTTINENEDGAVNPTVTTTPDENDNSQEVTTPQRSVETVEEFDNEISNRREVLNA